MHIDIMRSMNKILQNILLLGICAILCIPATLLGAHGNFSISPIPTAYADEAVQKNTSDLSRPNVYLVVTPHLNWTDITNEQTPTLQYLAGNYAVGNVVTESKVDIYALEQYDTFHYMRLNANSPYDIDQYVDNIYKNLGPYDSLIVTSSPSLAKIQTYDVDGYGMCILVDSGDNGMLTSSTVRRSGLITSSNLGWAINCLLDTPQRNPGNLSVYPLTTNFGALSRTKDLARNNSIATSIRDSEDLFIVEFFIMFSFTMILSLVLLFLDIKIKPSFLEHFLPMTRILWIVVLSIPLASYLMFLQLPSITTPEISFDYFNFVVLEISLICIVVALVFKWDQALIFMLGTTTFVLLVDQLFGGPMTATGYLSYSPLEVTRYYGIGNEGASLAFGAWIMFSGLILTYAKPNSPAAKRFKRWGFLASSVVILFIIGAPWWGANFGVIIWGTVGVACAWALFNEIKFSWKHVALIFALAAAAAFFVLVLDSIYNTESHMGTTVADLQAGWHLVAISVILNMIKLSVATISFSPILTCGFLIMAVSIVWLRVKKPAKYDKFWKEHPYFDGSYVAILITSLIMLLVEDSGILMPALLLLYNISGLLWMICDLHSWHIRDILENRRIANTQSDK